MTFFFCFTVCTLYFIIICFVFKSIICIYLVIHNLSKMRKMSNHWSLSGSHFLTFALGTSTKERTNWGISSGIC